jgi:Transposase DDE domain group 1
VVARLECSLQPVTGETGMCQKVDIRYVVASLGGSAQNLYENVHCQRADGRPDQAGQGPVSVGSHVVPQRDGQSGCGSFSTLPAFWLMHGTRAAVPRTSPLASAEFATIRGRLIKIGARAIEHIARIRVHLPTDCPEGRCSEP